LTFCQNDFLVLSACNAAARPFALCISAFLRHCCNEIINNSYQYLDRHLAYVDATALCYVPLHLKLLRHNTIAICLQY